jgi:tRNA threonylcarbamoyl adenosine modification protein YeaZ
MLYDDLMRTLYLDTASHTGILALVGKTTEAIEEIDHRIDDAELIVRLESFLQSAHSSYKEINRIACVAGPGGFTSLRVAVGLANALSSTLNIPSASVHLSDLYVARSSEKDFLWLHSTKKTEVFARGFGSLSQNLPEATHFVLHDLEKTLIPGTLWTGELIPEHEKIVTDAGLRTMKLRALQEILPEFLGELSYSKETVVPWYGRGW